MRFPWANIALIVLVVAELLTGYLGLTHSNPEWIGAMHLHRIFGFAILALFVWKSRNILGSLRTPEQLAPLPKLNAVVSRTAGGPVDSARPGAGMEPSRPLRLDGVLRHHHPHEPGVDAHPPCCCGIPSGTASACAPATSSIVATFYG